MSIVKLFAAFGAAAVLAACAGKPPPPDWQMNAQGAMERATAAYLSGNTRLEELEFSRARSEVARTGQADLLARIELMRCAAHVASLAFDDCPGFVALAQDAGAAERAYAEYLAGRQPTDAALLPASQRDVSAGGSSDALGRVTDPLSRLVAAGVLLRAGRAQPSTMAIAVDTASAQGWSRPLVAWLSVQAKGAEAAGDADEAARLRRRIGVVLGPAPKAASAP